MIMFKLGLGHRTKFKDIETQGGHHTFHLKWSGVLTCVGTPHKTLKMFKLGWNTAQNLENGESIQEPGVWWVGGWSNVILDPTLALIRAELGLRIQVRAECGNITYVGIFKEKDFHPPHTETSIHHQQK